MSTNSQVVVSALAPAPSLLKRIAQKYAVEENRMMSTLKATCFKGPVTDEQMVALLIVSEQYGLNPFTKEIYAFPDKNGGIVPVVGVDGWIRIINTHPNFQGMSFLDGPYNDQNYPQWIECTIEMRHRTTPMVIKEWWDECYRDTPAWNTAGRRMLRHRAMVQCARIAFGFAGIYEADEAERFASVVAVNDAKKPDTRAPRQRIKQDVLAISFDQVTALTDKLDAEGISLDAFNQAHGLQTIAQLPAKLYDSAVYWIETQSKTNA